MKNFEKAVILQDSVFIYHNFDFEFIEGVKFIWNFEHHWIIQKKKLKLFKNWIIRIKLLIFITKKIYGKDVLVQ